MLLIDGKERDQDEIVSAIRLRDRCIAHGVTNLVEADDEGGISGRAWGMFAEPSAHAENNALAKRAGCSYEQIKDSLADGRFFNALTGLTLLTIQLKHAGKKVNKSLDVLVFNCSRDGGTGVGKIAYNVADVDMFHFRESCPSSRSVFVRLDSFPVDVDGKLLTMSCRVNHDVAQLCLNEKWVPAVTDGELVELLREKNRKLHASLL